MGPQPALGGEHVDYHSSCYYSTAACTPAGTAHMLADTARTACAAIVCAPAPKTATGTLFLMATQPVQPSTGDLVCVLLSVLEQSAELLMFSYSSVLSTSLAYSPT